MYDNDFLKRIAYEITADVFCNRFSNVDRICHEDDEIFEEILDDVVHILVENLTNPEIGT